MSKLLSLVTSIFSIFDYCKYLLEIWDNNSQKGPWIYPPLIHGSVARGSRRRSAAALRKATINCSGIPFRSTLNRDSSVGREDVGVVGIVNGRNVDRNSNPSKNTIFHSVSQVGVVQHRISFTVFGFNPNHSVVSIWCDRDIVRIVWIG